MNPPLYVVYHAACIGAPGHYRWIIAEQLELLHEVGLHEVRITHVGPDRDWIEDECGRIGLNVAIVRSDLNTDHYETFAMLEIQRLAQESHLPILYLHTKGVSSPLDRSKLRWRRAMENSVVRDWRRNLDYLRDHDAVGFNWIEDGEQHFSGNFWIARPDWIRRLPDFATYHGAKGLVRYSCETWIGAAEWCRAVSLGCRNQPTWKAGFNWDALWPAAVKLNLGSNVFYAPGWVNIDVDHAHAADRYEDAVTLPSSGENEADEIYAGHLAEHVDDVRAAFRRWWAVLKPGGTITVTVPDCVGAVNLWLTESYFTGVACGPDEGLAAVATGYRLRPTDMPAARLQRHRRVFDRSTLAACLELAGFERIRAVDSHELMVMPCSALGWQIAMSARKPATGGHRDDFVRHGR